MKISQGWVRKWAWHHRKDLATGEHSNLPIPRLLSLTNSPNLLSLTNSPNLLLLTNSPNLLLLTKLIATDQIYCHWPILRNYCNWPDLLPLANSPNLLPLTNSPNLLLLTDQFSKVHTLSFWIWGQRVCSLESILFPTFHSSVSHALLYFILFQPPSLTQRICNQLLAPLPLFGFLSTVGVFGFLATPLNQNLRVQVRG